MASPEKKEKKSFSLLGFIFGTIKGLCTFIGAVILTIMVAGFLMADRINDSIEEKETPLADQMILTLRLDEGLSEASPESSIFVGFEGFGSGRLTTQEMVDVLDRASSDPRVKALSVSLESGSFGISHVQELRAAIARFRASGKPAWIYSPSYGEAGSGGMGVYYLASAFDEIWMQPVGLLALPGVDGEMPYGLEAINKLGVNPQYYQRKEYKSVMENFTRNEMSPESREMLSSILTDLIKVVIDDIARDRNMPREQVVKYIDQGVFTDEEALKAGLVTRIDYADVMTAAMREKLTGNAESEEIKFVSLSNYRDEVAPPPIPEFIKKHEQKTPAKPEIGLVYVHGTIVSDESQSGMSAEAAAADKISAALTKAAKDDGIKIIVVRIDSPGGSPTASETIRRAVEYAVKHKPVIVSMGSTAGSGGYWVATHATRIFAMPSTLTGSIGVVSGKADFSPMMEKIGVNWDGIRIGKNAGLWSFTAPFDESGNERMNAIVDNIYDVFVKRVAEGRKLAPGKVEEIARGRIWTGKQAVELGLVDELGGLDVALDYSAKQINLASRFDAEIVPLPRAKTPFDRLFELLNIEVAMGRIANVAMKMIGERVEQAATPSVSARDPLLTGTF